MLLGSNFSCFFPILSSFPHAGKEINMRESNILPNDVIMTSTTVIFDTNFFVGIIDNARSNDAIFDFVRMLRASFDENDIEAIIPFRVVHEIEQFHKPLSSFIEGKFRVYKPIDINKDQFYLNVKWMNLERHPDNRWFNASEITDLEIITVAKHVTEEQKGHSTGINGDAAWVVTNDEGIQKAAKHLLKNAVKIIEPAAFLGYMTGVTNDTNIRTEFEHMSKLIFKHFTRYRERFGRPPVSQLDQFFSGMLTSIKMAREDAKGFFDEEAIIALDKHLMLGCEMESPEMTMYKPAMVIMREIMNEDDGKIANTLQEHVNRLSLALVELNARLKELTNYTRFYNYISPYLARAYIISFKTAFMNHDLDRAFTMIGIAKTLVQPLINRPSISRLYFSIFISECAARLVSGYDGGMLSQGALQFLKQTLEENIMPALVPEEHVRLLLLVDACARNDIEASGQDAPPLPFSDDVFSKLSILAEDFADEITRFGNLTLALRIYAMLHDKADATPEKDQKIRIEGKFFLTCMLLQGDSCTGSMSRFPGDWERTMDALDACHVHGSWTSIEHVHDDFQHKIKILNYDRARNAFTCWVYPLRSRFLIDIPAPLIGDNKINLKEIKVRAGSIKVTGFEEGDRKVYRARGKIAIDKDCEVDVYTYQARFFTLNVL